MRKLTTILISAILALALLPACSTTTGERVESPELTTQTDGVAVFGKVSLVEEILIFMPTGDQDADLYLRSPGSKYTIKVNCEDSGDFGVYLPFGEYRVARIEVGGYSVKPDITLSVPRTKHPLYAGTILLDGTPTGVKAGTEDAMFVYSVKDESREFARNMETALPGSAKNIRKSLFVPMGAMASGEYPVKVERAQDIKNKLDAKTKTLEEVITGATAVLTNPLWLVPMDMD